MHSVPGAPKNLCVKNVDGAKVTVSWVQPENDGGSPITDYVVLYCDAEKNKYKECGTIKADCLEFTSEKLKRGKEYKFKVLSKNEVGVSESGAELEQSVQIKEKTEKKEDSKAEIVKAPIIETQPGSTSVIVGETIKLAIKVTGE